MTLLMRDQENIEKGIEKGMEKGKAEGKVEGKAEGIIELGFEVGLSEGEILERLQKKMNIPLQTAREYFVRFGKQTV